MKGEENYGLPASIDRRKEAEKCQKERKGHGARQPVTDKPGNVRLNPALTCVITLYYSYCVLAVPLPLLILNWPSASTAAVGLRAGTSRLSRTSAAALHRSSPQNTGRNLVRKKKMTML